MPRMDRICPNNTAVFTGDDAALTVVLHQTAVFKKYPDGRIELNSGGWRTVTTKNRINQAFRQLAPSMRARVHQENGDWFVQVGGYETGRSIPFADHMVIPA
jgi:hypothetical protein